jgi:hypothetical protein
LAGMGRQGGIDPWSIPMSSALRSSRWQANEYEHCLRGICPRPPGFWTIREAHLRSIVEGESPFVVQRYTRCSYDTALNASRPPRPPPVRRFPLA